LLEVMSSDIGVGGLECEMMMAKRLEGRWLGDVLAEQITLTQEIYLLILEVDRVISMWV